MNEAGLEEGAERSRAVERLLSHTVIWATVWVLATSELSEFGATTESVVVDLAQPTGTREVSEAVAGRPVDVLVNDAGVGGRGRFATARPLTADLAMIQLNVAVLVVAATAVSAVAYRGWFAPCQIEDQC
jgi:NAD(P)-dependent dehydrogenase (short-subunit alcohol dehydrogenase family)